MIQNLSGKSVPRPEHGKAYPHNGNLSEKEYAGLAVGDPFNEAGLIAAGKKLCGTCDFKTGLKKIWKCLHSSRLPCPVPDPQAGCLGFRQSARSRPRPPQPKKKGLPVPEGVKFLYIGAPRGKTQKGVPQHQGVVTVAWITPSPGTLHLGFSFCSPKDRWCKITGRDMALARLLRPLVIPFLYDTKRTVHEVVRAVLTHDFMRIAVLSPGATMWGRVPDWTRGLAKRMSKTRVVAIYRLPGSAARIIANLKEFEIKHLPLNIMTRMMRDIAALGNG